MSLATAAAAAREVEAVFRVGGSMNLAAIQEELPKQKLDGWLFFDHHQRDPLAYRVLGFHAGAHVPRAAGITSFRRRASRAAWCIASKRGMLDALPGEKIRYSSWTEQVGGLAQAAGRRAPRRHAVFADVRHSLCLHGGRGHRGTGAQPGRRGGELGGTDPALRSALDARRRSNRIWKPAGAWTACAPRLSS